MKKFLLNFGLVSLFLSCTIDDSNLIQDSDFYGEWYLLSAEADREIDYNFDGITSTDIMDDLSCFTIELQLNPDNTFREVIIDRPMNDDNLECAISQNNGKWEYFEELKQIKFSYLDENGGLINEVKSNFTINKNSSFKFLRGFSDEIGTFKADLQFVFLH